MRMEDKQPLISVIMGVYYRKESVALLRRAVQSILDQSYPNFEFLICDDGSNQGALETLNQFAEQDDRIRLVRGIQRMDLAAKLNACLRLAKGTYIARMDDDDWSAPERFEKQLRALDGNKEVSFLGCNVLLCRNGQVYGERVLPELPKVENFYMTQPFVHPTIIFRKDALLSVGGYSEGKRQFLCEDYDLLLRLYAAGYCGMNLQENLLTYTVSASAKANRRMSHRWNEAVTRFCRFRDLKVLPWAFPYVVKPLVIGIMPEFLLSLIKDRRGKRTKK